MIQDVLIDGNCLPLRYRHDLRPEKGRRFLSFIRLMKLRSLRLLTIALFLGATGVPASLYAQSLEEAIKRTLDSNPDVLIEVSRRMAAEGGKNRARAGFMPIIELRSGTGREEKHNASTDTTYGGRVNQEKREGSLTLTQMLFDGFSVASDFKRNEARVNSASHRLAAISEQVALRAIEAYLEVLRQQEILALTKENVVSHERTLDQIEQRVTGGFARQSDLDQIKARVALAKSNYTTADANQEVAIINYKFIIGVEPGALIRPKPVHPQWVPQSVDDALHVALTGNRLMHQARADLDAAKAQLNASRASFSPRLDLEMGKTQTFNVTPIDQPRDLGKYAMLKFRFNLFSGGSDMAKVSESRAQMMEAEEVLNRGKRQLEQTVRMAWSAYRAAGEKLENLQQHSERSRLSRDAYVKQFTLGQRTLLDLLDSENEFFTAQSNFINGQFVELFARYRVLAETGYLLAAIGIDPREESHSDQFNSAMLIPPNPNAEVKQPTEELITPTPSSVPSVDPLAPPSLAPAASAPVAPAAPVTALAPPSVSTPSPSVLNPAAAEQVKPAGVQGPVTESDQTKTDISLAIASWLDAWSNKDPEHYLGAYSESYVPEKKGESRNEWLEAKKKRLLALKEVSVTHAGLNIKVEGDRATVKFIQDYRAGKSHSSTDKVLLMVKEDGQWRILKEQVGK